MNIYYLIRSLFSYSQFLSLNLIRVSAFVHLFLCNLVTVDATPSVEDISNHKRNENGNISHRFQSKLAGTAICQSQ